mmetsp:Transcript_16379/g.46856  ORF Transcript_16379/g.46856 Transcript_16379/m.46856 type:complete len:206 (-) Transcript_16379:256-873(-)
MSNISNSLTLRCDTSCLASVKSLYHCFCSKPFGMYARKRSNASTSLGVPFFSCKSKFLVSKRITPANNNPISSGSSGVLLSSCSATRVQAEPRPSTISPAASGCAFVFAWWSRMSCTRPWKTAVTFSVILLWSVRTTARSSKLWTACQSISFQNLRPAGLPSGSTSLLAALNNARPSPRNRNSSRGICATGTPSTSGPSKSRARA